MGQMVYILALLFIASIVSQSTEEQYQEKYVQKSRLMLEYNWPEPSKSLNRLPHPHSCHHFIHTKHDGTHVVKRCHGDKVFDYRSLRCQNKLSAKCWMDIVKKGNMKKVKHHFSCPFPWGLYPDKEDCTLFYDCMGGKVFPTKCPDSTLFDIVERICVHSSKALCAQDSVGCRADTDCDFHEACINNQCIDPCASLTACGTKAQCQTVNHRPLCSCLPEHTGDPRIECSRVECSIDSDCGAGRICQNYRCLDISARSRIASQPQRLFVTIKSEKDIPSENIDSVSTVIAFEPSGTFGVHSKESNSEDADVKNSIKSENKATISKSPFISGSIINQKSFTITDADSEENSLEEVTEKGPIKSKNKYITSKSPFIARSTRNRKTFTTRDADSEENSSEEVTEKGRTTFKNKYTTSKSRFNSTSTANSKSFTPTNTDSVEDSSEEENSSEEKGNEISSKYELKSTIFKDRSSSASTYRKEDVISISTNMFSENPQIISSSQGGHSTEVPFQVSTIKPLVSTENNLNSVKTIATLEVSKKDNTNDDIKKTSLATEIISEEFTSSVEPFSHKRIDPTTKIPFTDSSTFRSEITENIEIGSKSVATSSILCPDFDSYLPHPNNKHLYVACVGGTPTVMKCPGKLVYDSNTASCIYDKI